MGSLKLCVILCVAGLAVGDKGPTGIQSHHITGQGGYDSFGQEHASVPAYDSKGKGYAYGQDGIPVVYYEIPRPKPEKGEKGKGYFKEMESKIKEYKDKFTKFMKDSMGYGEPDYDYYTAPATEYGPPADSYGPPPTDSYGPPPINSYGPPAHEVVDYHYDYEEEKDKGFVSKMKDYYSKFAKEMDKASKKMKEMFGYGDYDYDYEVVEVPAPGYGAPPHHAPVSSYGAPAPAPAYGAPAPHHEPAVVYQPIPHPKEPKAEKGSFFKASKAPKGQHFKKPRPGHVYTPPHYPAPQYPAPAAPVHHAQAAPVYHAPVHHAPAALVHHAPAATFHHAATYAPQPSEYGPPKIHDITHGQAAAPVKAKGGHAHHKAPAPSSGVSSYTSHLTEH